MLSRGSSVGSRHASMLEVQRVNIKYNQPKPVSSFNLEAFLDALNFQGLIDLDDEELEIQLQEIDALDLLNSYQEISRQTGTIKLENHFITDFIEKNDPKLLIGLKQRRATLISNRRSLGSSVGRSPVNTARMSGRPSVVTTQSVFTLASGNFQMGAKKAATDYRLNFRAKTEMAEKTASEAEKRIKDMETKAMHRMKMLNTRIEELRYGCTEMKETAKNFELHFLKDERDIAFLETATERQLERKLRKFVNNWLKNGRALLGTMRLRITSLQDACAQQRSDLMTKADLSGTLRAVDFEQLMIKRDELLNALEEKNAHLTGLKNVTAKASLAMSEEKKVMANIEHESKRITDKTLDIQKSIAKLEREAKYVESGNEKDAEVLRQLIAEVERYDAPSVNEYIERKDELLALEKEEKLLKRKIHILNMKLTNLLKRCKRRDELANL